MSIFKDKTGKVSSKRILGSLAIVIGLLMAVSKYFLEEKGVVSDTLILGIIGTGFAAVASGVFEKVKHIGNRPDDR